MPLGESWGVVVTRTNKSPVLIDWLLFHGQKETEGILIGKLTQTSTKTMNNCEEQSISGINIPNNKSVIWNFKKVSKDAVLPSFEYRLIKK